MKPECLPFCAYGFMSMYPQIIHHTVSSLHLPVYVEPAKVFNEFKHFSARMSFSTHSNFKDGCKCSKPLCRFKRFQ